MKYFLALLFLLFPVVAPAVTTGQAGVDEVHRCIMQADAAYCHSIMTPESAPIFDRFSSHNLMPCLPTNFTYASEEPSDNHVMAKATMPAGGGKIYIVRLAFQTSPSGAPLLDLPASLKRGLGETWQDKLQLAEQLYVMMKQNMGDKLTCDMLDDLVKKP